MGDDLELDVGVIAQERAEARHQPVRGQGRADRQLHDAARLLAGGGRGRLRAERRRGHRFGVLAEFAAMRRQRQAVIGTREQAGPELLLERRDVAADGGMADAQPPCRPGKAACLRHRHECLAKLPVHAAPLPATPFISGRSNVQY
ncbi:hypothetical protein AB7M56_009161 [Bradyrhizobium elkanii]